MIIWTGSKPNMKPSMKRFAGIFDKARSNSGSQQDFSNAPSDSPEGTASRGVRLFCESGDPNNRDEEVLHLPVIVEACESSPQAAAAAAQQIRIFLTKEYGSKPHVQYNSIMLIRILSDNPGPTFTRCFDKAFIGTVKDCLRQCKDHSVQRMLRETLDHLEVGKSYQDGVYPLMAMWRKEKGPQAGLREHHATPTGERLAVQTWPQAPPSNNAQQRPAVHQTPSYLARGSNRLPPPAELASRVEESRNTAKILLQLIQSTPQDELLRNDLISEFSERCQGAQRSMQNYINCNSPAPDDDTMLTLIETNEQLSLANSRHHRAVLAARRALGVQRTASADGAGTEGVYASGAVGIVFAPEERQRVAIAQSQPPQLTNFSNSGFGSGAFGATAGLSQPHGNDREEYSAPSGPPPKSSGRFGSQESSQQRQASIQSTQERPSNPFEDPVEYSDNPAPLAHDASPGNDHANNYLVKPGPAYESTHPDMPRRDTAALENAYSATASPTISAPSPDLYARSPTSPQNGYQPQPVSAQSPRRPQVGAWHNSTIGSSYVRRQDSAANGFTMHGAQPAPVNEIDSHSQVGRNERGDGRLRTPPGHARESEDNDMYNVSPVEARRAEIPARY